MSLSDDSFIEEDFLKNIKKKTHLNKKDNNNQDESFKNKIKLNLPNKNIEKDSFLYIIINLYVLKRLEKGSLYCFFYGEESYDIFDHENVEDIENELILEENNNDKSEINIIQRNSKVLIGKNRLHKKLSTNNTFNKLSNDFFRDRNANSKLLYNKNSKDSFKDRNANSKLVYNKNNKVEKKKKKSKTRREKKKTEVKNQKKKKTKKTKN